MSFRPQTGRALLKRTATKGPPIHGNSLLGPFRSLVRHIWENRMVVYVPYHYLYLYPHLHDDLHCYGTSPSASTST